MVRSNAIQILEENFNSSDFNSLSEYVRENAENDPNFFRWLFDEPFNNDFDSDLTDDQRNEYSEFLRSLENRSVKFTDDNKTMAVVYGCESIQEAESELDTFLENQGPEYGRGQGSEEENEVSKPVFYFRIIDNS